jgi:hypothetical protein
MPRKTGIDPKTPEGVSLRDVPVRRVQCEGPRKGRSHESLSRFPGSRTESCSAIRFRWRWDIPVEDVIRDACVGYYPNGRFARLAGLEGNPVELPDGATAM